MIDQDYGCMPAFPVQNPETTLCIGLTKREYITIEAMKTLLAHDPNKKFSLIALYATRMADQMIRQLNNPVDCE